jgi:tryptophanyl-tRNA synthetase
MKIPILRLRDKDGKEIAIPAIRGPRGPAGSGTGDMMAEVYDPNNHETDIFAHCAETVETAVGEAKQEVLEAVEGMLDEAKQEVLEAVEQDKTTEEWTFTLEDGSTVTKAVCVG